MLRGKPVVEKRHSISARRAVSKHNQPIRAAFIGSLLIFTFALAVRGSGVNVAIRVDPGEPASARVRLSGIDPSAGNSFVWFLDEYGSAKKLAERVTRVGLLDRSGRKVAERRILPGERLNIAGAGGIEYRILLKQPTSPFAAAHVSWVGAGGGIVMLDDLLPQGIGREAAIRLEMPVGWKALVPGDGGADAIQVANIEKTAIRIGPEIRETRVKTAAGDVRIGISGEWLFTDADAAKMAASIADEYARMLGKSVGGEFTVSIARFPYPADTGNWEGDTRGRSVTIFSSDMPFKNQSLQRLHEQLRHEIFHLWIPNGVSLTGRYDWFYEGFALYQSLRTGVELNQLRFEDYLDTLARASDIDAVGPRASLIDAGRDRWNGFETHVYARGMLLAFMCDLLLLEATKGKMSVSDILRDVVAASRSAAPREGNAAVIEVLRKHRELRPVVEKYVFGSDEFAWADVLRGAGIVASRNGASARLTVDPKASGAAKRILEKLGIDNWRRNPAR